MLPRVLRGRFTFTPDGEGYEFAAPTRFDKMFTGKVAPVPAWMGAQPLGAEHIGPEDTPDGHYGRLLEGAERALKGWRPWRVSDPNASALAVCGRVRVA